MHIRHKASVELSQLVIVDMQTRLMSAMPDEAMQMTIKNCTHLVTAAAMLTVPTVITEQYSKGLGHTVPEILNALSQATIPLNPIEKTAFSCMAEPTFRRQLSSDKSQIILAGMEAHICVLQTALDLVDNHFKQVLVVEDAIISRNSANKANAIARLRDAGCIITNTESTLFEWLGKAEGEAFKVISKMVK